MFRNCCLCSGSFDKKAIKRRVEFDGMRDWKRDGRIDIVVARMRWLTEPVSLVK
jgi:hypothetical protein